ncbi:hypothetical protein GOODEAATRI_015897 [Goodea atripinnis]|uniref:Secreted protein n=1 Tax=Goodea atripinnis TaxID=208336 RepID=A0ABV0PP08_9TELE
MLVIPIWRRKGIWLCVWMILQMVLQEKEVLLNNPTLQLKLLLHMCNSSLTVAGNGVSPVFELPCSNCFISIAHSSSCSTYHPSLFPSRFLSLPVSFFQVLLSFYY